jgi:hypothetical protein
MVQASHNSHTDHTGKPRSHDNRVRKMKYLPFKSVSNGHCITHAFQPAADFAGQFFNACLLHQAEYSGRIHKTDRYAGVVFLSQHDITRQ